jgi:hypothetical protein
VKTKLLVFVAFVGGIALGVFLARPEIVHAQTGTLRVVKVSEGMNPNPFLIGKSVVGFSCVNGGGEAECYVALQ